MIARFRVAGSRQLNGLRVLAALVLLTSAACDDDGTSSKSAVNTVSVSAPSTTLEAGRTMQLTATAMNAAGKALSGKSFTWSSSSDAVATVAADGTVTGRSAGSVQITAQSGGKTGQVSLTVTPVAVSTVTVTPDTASVAVGTTRQLTAVLKDAAGNTLTGRAVSWSTSNSSVASVSGGLVSAVSAGTATITAESEGKQGRATVTVFVLQASRVVVTPQFTTVDVGSNATFRASAVAANGDTVRGATVAWSSDSARVATVDASGVARGLAEGVTRITAQVGALPDTAVLAVLGSRTLLSTALLGGAFHADVKAGQTVTVPVTLDLSRVGNSGDLGSAQFDLTFDPAVLEYVSSAVGTSSGSMDVNLASPGRLRFAFAATTAQSSPRLTLVTVTFRVAAGASAGTRRELGLTYTARPTSTSFGSYDLPLTIGGRIRVVP